MRLPFLLLTFCLFTSYFAQAQVAEYLMENSVNDNVGSNDGDYIESGSSSGNSPLYISGSTGQRIVLDPNQGIALPSSLNALLDTATSIQIEMDIKMADLGADLNLNSGWKYLMAIAAYDGLNGPGMWMFTTHDIFDGNPSYEIYFGYSDGGFDQGIPDHPGHDKTTIGFASEGDEVSIKLVLDFENNQWSSLVNGNYTSKFFDTIAYDFDVVKETIVNEPAYIGWINSFENSIGFNPEVYTATVEFDNVKYFSPREPGDANILITALNAFENHCNGSNPLSGAALEGFLNDIYLNYHGNFTTAEAHVFDFINAYEANYPPVLEDRNPVEFSSLPQESQALLFIQQKIHDEQFVPGNIGAMAGVKYEFADVFPGLVDSAAPRVSGGTANINGSSDVVPGARLAADNSDTKRPTGYYAAPGEVVSITIPSNMIGAGLKALVGIHEADHSFLSQTNRFVRISKEFALDNTTTLVANPFGGGIYIKVPQGSDLDWFTITIDNAVKSPYFSTISGHETSVADWQSALSNNWVQWGDMESEKYMMTLPVAHVSPISDVVTLMDSLDGVQNAFRYVGGRPYERGRAEHFIVDSRLPSNAFGTGYPQVIGDYESPYGPFDAIEYYPTIVLEPDFHTTSFTTTMHESGHLALHPTRNYETESIVHLPAVYLYNVHYNQPLDTAFKYSAFELLVMDEAAMDWMIADNFRDNIEMSCDPLSPEFECDEVRYQHRGHAKYVEMAELFGWQAVHKMNKVFYDKWKLLDSYINSASDDEMIAAASAAAGVNMAPLFHFWGVHPSPEMAEQLAYMPESMDILNRLNYYKTIVPANTAAFQPWHDILRERKGPPHYIRYDYYIANYDTDNIAQGTLDQIDFLIATYFGQSPCVQQLTLSEITGSGTYRAEDWLQSGQLIHPDANVTLSGNNSVELLEGFETQAGSQVMINLDGCVE